MKEESTSSWSKKKEYDCICGAQHGTIDGSWKCTEDCLSNSYKEVCKESVGYSAPYCLHLHSSKQIEPRCRCQKCYSPSRKKEDMSHTCNKQVPMLHESTSSWERFWFTIRDLTDKEFAIKEYIKLERQKGYEAGLRDGYVDMAENLSNLSKQ